MKSCGSGVDVSLKSDNWTQGQGFIENDNKALFYVVQQMLNALGPEHAF